MVTYLPEAISLGPIKIDFEATPVPYYYFMIVLVAVAGLIYWRIGKSRLGRTFFSVAVNPMLAEHQGIQLMKFRPKSWCLDQINFFEGRRRLGI